MHAPMWLIPLLILLSLIPAPVLLSGWQGPLPVTNERDAEGRVDESAWAATLTAALEQDVRALAGKYPSRSPARPARLEGAAAWIESRLQTMGYTVAREPFEATDERGTIVTLRNLYVEVPPNSPDDRWLVVGAHYDTVTGTPGADDNASGVAGVLAIASWFRGRPQAIGLRFEFYSNEEALFLHSKQVGSLQRARKAVEAGESIVGAIVLEMIGHYTGNAVSPEAIAMAEQYQVSLPETDLFLAVAGWETARTLADAIVTAWRGPVEAVAVIGPVGDAMLARSDHWSYLQAGVPAVMLTDTAEFRNPHYHGRGDAPSTLDFERMAQAVEAIRGVVTAIATQPPTVTPVTAPGRLAVLRNEGDQVIQVRLGWRPGSPVDLQPGEALEVDGRAFAPITLEGLALVHVGAGQVRVEGDSASPVRVTVDGDPMQTLLGDGAWTTLPRTGVVRIGPVTLGF